MIRKTVLKKTSLFFLIIVFLLPYVTNAQGSLSLSVTPTLFDVSLEPGGLWKSSVRVVNPNEYPLTVYIEPVNFTSENEQGISNFTPIIRDDEVSGVTLAEWISLDKKSVTVEPQAVKPVSFTISVPEDAPPGGHYAALIVSTQPSISEVSGSRMFTTQAVSALFFMRVEGDVVELGSVRSFRASNSFANRPENQFELRFENLGNVHLQPQGHISIYNMWSQSRGEIPINQSNQFGKVLPESIRQFNFGWEGDFSIYDIGRYRAEVTVAYGEKDRRFVSSETSFWVIPITGVLTVGGAFIFIILIISLLIRLYVRRVLIASGVTKYSNLNRKLHPSDVTIDNASKQDFEVETKNRYLSLYTFFKTTYYTLKNKCKSRPDFKTIIGLLFEYRVIISLMAVFLICFIIVIFYFRSVLSDNRIYEVTITDHESTQVISSEELIYEQYKQQGFSDHVLDIDLQSVQNLDLDDILEVKIVNVSGNIGVGATLALELEKKFINISINVDSDFGRADRRSVVVFDSKEVDIAQNLSRLLGGALLSPYPEDVESDIPIKLYIGTDILK